MADQNTDVRQELDQLYESNLATYRRFVTGTLLFSAHVLVILAILAYFAL